MTSGPASPPPRSVFPLCPKMVAPFKSIGLSIAFLYQSIDKCGTDGGASEKLPLMLKCGNFICGRLILSPEKNPLILSTMPLMMSLAFSIGMDPSAAFPIMMGSCALLMPVASAKFIKEDTYAKKNSILIALSGLVGVVVAYKFFSGLDIEKLKILVVIVVTITGLIMLKSAFKKTEEVK
ncbi:hypothetical protein [Asaccharospora irregularis]|uniref:hypothetical protein n=1 Tax=Asaccharospora irregularis TaxID=29359 RepID=UPI00116081E2|nr:hypothetical protein [Asaccharospora irregularis]